MPAKVKVRILAGRNLPVMDKSSDASDAFVEVKLGQTTYKTEVYRRSLNPFWNSEWFRFEVSDQELQDEPLQIRIMDYDTYSANDAIGKVYINLNPLLLNSARSMSGWLPIYDTLHGIRGEINCMVKVNLFPDNNRFRQSSCGVRFFFSDIPQGYRCDAILGFVDELLVNDDPEYQWIDKIRTPRASNEARQTLFTKLSGEVQRKLGLKAEIFGGNAVIGYQQWFDLEGGSGIVGRGIGTAVVLSRESQSDEDEVEPEPGRSPVGCRRAPNNPPSSSSGRGRGRGRPMTRAKELDLGDEAGDVRQFEAIEAELAHASRAGATSVSSAELAEEEEGEELDSAREIRMAGTGSDTLADSTPSSSSFPTDDTIKAARPDAEARPVSPPASTSKGGPTLCRSDTDLAHAQLTHQAGGPTAQTAHLLNRCESAHSRHQSVRGALRAGRLAGGFADVRMSSARKELSPGSRASANFAKSVGVIRAQQHLLQNMIKHQNQSLVTNSMNKAKQAHVYPGRVQQSEYPFVTLKRYPAGLIQATGGVVSVHSVKLLDHIINDEESETRDIWWTELRREIRSHAKSLNCNTILGYTESSKVLGDVCILSARGTAAILKPIEPSRCGLSRNRSNSASGRHALRVPSKHSSGSPPPPPPPPPPSHSSMPPLASGGKLDDTPPREQQSAGPRQTARRELSLDSIDCSLGHTPMHCVDSLATLANCSICCASKVPDVLLLTIEPPSNLNIASTCGLVQARVCRNKRDSHGEASAKEIGEALPFLEYELHRQLFSKLKFRGFNCLFSLQVDISAGENFLTGVATGTGCFVLGLPTPDAPQIIACKGITASKLDEIQHLISLAAAKNRELLGLNEVERQLEEYHKHIGLTVGSLDEQFTGASPTSPKSATSGELRGPGEPRTQTDQPTGARAAARPERPSEANAPTGSEMGGEPQVQKQTVGGLAAQAGKKPQQQQQSAHKHRHRHHHHHRHKRQLAEVSESSTGAPEEQLLSMLNDDSNIVLEVDDNQDADIIALLIDNDVPAGYSVCNSELVPTVPQHSIAFINMFTQVTRVKLAALDQFAQQFEFILQTLYVKLRRSLPCCLTNLSFVVDLPESHVVQITLTGCLMSLKPPCPLGSASELGGGLRIVASRLPASSTSFSPTSVSVGSSATSTSSAESPSSPAGSSSASSESSGRSGSAKADKSSTSEVPRSSTNSSSSTNASTGLPAAAKPTGVKSAGALIKQTSKALMSAAGLSRLSRQGGGEQSAMELAERKTGPSGPEEASAPSTRETIATVRQDIEASRLGARREKPATVSRFRAVFRKQRSYPGASAPQISGQDNILADQLRANNPASTGGPRAARKATALLKRVKQPFRDLGSNLNASHANEGLTVTFAGSPQASSEDGPSTSGVQRAARAPGSRLKCSRRASALAHQRVSLGGARIATSSSSSTLMDVGSPLTQLHLKYASMGAGVRGHADFGALVSRRHFASAPSSSSYSISSSIDISSLSYIPGARHYQYLGNLTLSFVRESNSVRENGGLNGFIHSFLMEVYAIVRAHVSALGGNAFLSFRLQQSCIFYHSNKNQAQCLISIAGDAVQVSL